MQLTIQDPDALTLVFMGDNLVGMMSLRPIDQVLAALKVATAHVEAQIAAQDPFQAPEEEETTPEQPAQKEEPAAPPETEAQPLPPDSGASQPA